MENLKLVELEDYDLCLDVKEDGTHIVYLDNRQGEELEESEIMIETSSYEKAEKVFENTKKYMS